MKRYVAVPLIVLVCAIWFAPEKPLQVLRAFHLMMKAVGPGNLPGSSTPTNGVPVPPLQGADNEEPV